MTTQIHAPPQRRSDKSGQEPKDRKHDRSQRRADLFALLLIVVFFTVLFGMIFLLAGRIDGVGDPTAFPVFPM